MQKISPSPKDVFADIGTLNPGAALPALQAPEPPALPRRVLPLASASAKAAFTPKAKIDTPEKLDRELVRQRRLHAPFLRNLAPVPAATRETIPVPSFDWRIARPEDWQSFPAVLAGAGPWERVSIPHYGEPLGKASTFYRATFQLTADHIARRAVFVCFRGVDYLAHVFVNGSLLGSHEGLFAPFEFDATAAVRPGANELFVRVDNDHATLGSTNHKGHPDIDGDKIYAATGPGYDEPENGWHHSPSGMGIYQAVAIEIRPRVQVRDLFVRPLPAEDRAEAWVEVHNCDPVYRPVALEFSLHGRNFSKPLFRDRTFGEVAPAGPGVNYYRVSLPLPKARLWSPATPWLYQLQVTVKSAQTAETDTRERQFGQRSFTLDEASTPKGRLLLNGKEIRLRGANTMGFEQRDVMEGKLDQLVDDLLLAKIGHMNFLRLTQRPVQEEVYDFCDRLGLMTQTDLPLFGLLRRNQFAEAVRQAGEMEHFVRSHPCNVMVSFINEPLPEHWRKRSHRSLTRPELEQFFAAASILVRQANPDRVIKPADGDYDPPGPGICDRHCYTFWYNGHAIDAGKLHRGYWLPVKPDWHYGCGEFGTEGLDRADLIRKYAPAGWLPASPADEKTWTPGRISMAQGGRFHRLFHDSQDTLEAWSAASREHQARSLRIMTEAFRRHDNMNTFAVHLFIDAWPMGWMKTIMDVERRPKPGYFAYREALTPLAVQLRTDRWHWFGGEKASLEAWIVNDTHDIPAGATLRSQLEIEGRVLRAASHPAKVPACRAAFQGFVQTALPPVARRTPATLRLALCDRAGRVIHDTAIDLTLFPAPEPAALPVAVLGPKNGPAHRLAAELGLKPLRKAPGRARTILIDDFAAFRPHAAAVAEAVEAGATAVFLALPPGRHEIAGGPVTVENAAMGPRHFVSRRTGHPWVEGFAPDDFRFWHDPAVDYVTPIASTLLQAEGWNPVLLSSQEQPGQDWKDAYVTVEKPHGQGRWVLNQLQLAGRTSTNPVAREFALRLIGNL
jgi:hypothetical protein